MTAARFVIGIDLGTTNSALAFCDTIKGEAARLEPFSIPQVVQPGVVEERPLLPSFEYLPGAGEQPAGALKLPWAAKRDFCVGEFARLRQSGADAAGVLCEVVAVPSRRGSRGPILPWKAPENGRRVSPLEASTAYLQHLVDAWNHRHAKDGDEAKLEAQDVVLTVPASFDAAAREMTVEAAQAAGIEHLTLLEEPQAAYYAWLNACGDAWREQVEVGDMILVVDVGGGTTDLTLISVGEEEGSLTLTRVAVGDHILLGGDNMDLALAHHAAGQFAAKGTKLDQGQLLMLWHSCRLAKETLFSQPNLHAAPVTVLGRGSKVIGGTLKTELTRADVEKVLIEGFFPHCPANAEPTRQRAVGLMEIGLPYAADPAISKHLAQFLARNDEVLRGAGKKSKRKGIAAVLFNGGVFKAAPLRARLLDILNQWNKSPVRDLHGTDLDQAVAAGAAYYGRVRRGQGVRIRGGTARSYYIGVESSLPAVPGSLPPLKALCVAPFGMEEGTEADVPGLEFGLIVGSPATFRFLGSTTRRADTVGLMIEDWEGSIDELSPITTTLDSPGKEGRTVPVHLHCKVTPIGTLEIWCLSRDNKQRWKLEFNVREGKDAEAGAGSPS